MLYQNLAQVSRELEEQTRRMETVELICTGDAPFD